MKTLLKYSMALIVGTSFLSGCAGYDRILFVTKTNVGLDVENKPPTAEITIARRELAILPTYRDTIGNEKTLPLLGSFGLTGGFFTPRITSVFAGGDAAVYLARGNPSANGVPTDAAPSSHLCLEKEPNGLKDDKRDTRPFFFATDTVFGLKVGWDGTGGPYPTNLKLGYNRKELASPPIFAKQGCKMRNSLGEMVSYDELYEVKVASFFAKLDNGSALASIGDSTLSHVQFFATGKAATAFAQRTSVNIKTFEIMTRGAAALEQNPN